MLSISFLAPTIWIPSHHLSRISYSLCSFCVHIISPIKPLGFLDMWLQKKCTYIDQINGEVQQTLKERLRGHYTSRSYHKIVSWNHTLLDLQEGMPYTLCCLQGLMGNYLLNVILRKCCLVKCKLWGKIRQYQQGGQPILVKTRKKGMPG